MSNVNAEDLISKIRRCKSEAELVGLNSNLTHCSRQLDFPKFKCVADEIHRKFMELDAGGGQ